MYKIINLNAFCKYNGKTPEIGIALDGYFASTAWIESDEKFNGIIGAKFGWYSPNDNANYCNSKHSFSRPTEQEVIDKLWQDDALDKYALDNGLAVFINVQPTIDKTSNIDLIDESHWLTEDVMMPDLGSK